jgi:hypothetical protein
LIPLKPVVVKHLVDTESQLGLKMYFLVLYSTIPKVLPFHHAFELNAQIYFAIFPGLDNVSAQSLGRRFDALVA